MDWSSVVEKGRDGNISAGTGWPFSLALCHWVTFVVMAHLALKNPEERGQLGYGLCPEGQIVTMVLQCCLMAHLLTPALVGNFVKLTLSLSLITPALKKYFPF